MCVCTLGVLERDDGGWRSVTRDLRGEKFRLATIHVSNSHSLLN